MGNYSGKSLLITGFKQAKAVKQQLTNTFINLIKSLNDPISPVLYNY